MKRFQWIPHIIDGVCVNGCLVATDDDFELYGSMLASARSISIQTIWETGDMPVLQWDGDFEAYLKQQIELHDTLRANRTQCVLPWEVLKELPENRKRSDRLYWSQGGLGSCMGHADAFAGHSAILSQIAVGAPLIYDPFNPVVTWALSKGGSLSGGQSVSPMAKWANNAGHYPESLVGTNNQRMPGNWREHQQTARKYQWALAFIPGSGEILANNVINVCRAGYAVSFGNSTRVTGSTMDGNGIKIATIGGTWAHATHFAAYRTVKSTEYIGWVNSHGGRYKPSDEMEPADMVWMPRKQVEQMMSTATRYGQPYIVLPESVWLEKVSDNTPLSVPFPNNWRW